VRVLLTTSHVRYLRCEACQHTWTQWIPGAPLLR